MSDFLELKFQVTDKSVGVTRVSPGNQTQILWKSIKLSQPLSPILPPPHNIFALDLFWHYSGFFFLLFFMCLCLCMPVCVCIYVGTCLLSLSLLFKKWPLTGAESLLLSYRLIRNPGHPCLHLPSAEMVIAVLQTFSVGDGIKTKLYACVALY